MCCKSWKTFLPFLLTFMVGFLISTYIEELRTAKSTSEPILLNGDGRGKGGGKSLNCFACNDGHIENNEKSIKEYAPNKVNVTKSPLKIISKPRANFTEGARTNQTEGTVTLRVTFNANGTIGSISTVTNLPDGLTEQAIEAARQITFEPEIRNGKAITLIKLVQYNFMIY